LTAEMNWTLEEVTPVLRAAWSLDTCDEVDLADWSPENPARGQCGVTALVLQELLGGDLLMAEVHFAHGGLQGVHYWNRLPDGQEIDLTREQFRPDEIVGEPEVVERPPGLPEGGTHQYRRLRNRVRQALVGRSVPAERASA
jgi:hypothetical protein